MGLPEVFAGVVAGAEASGLICPVASGINYVTNQPRGERGFLSGGPNGNDDGGKGDEDRMNEGWHGEDWDDI